MCSGARVRTTGGKIQRALLFSLPGRTAVPIKQRQRKKLLRPQLVSSWVPARAAALPVDTRHCHDRGQLLPAPLRDTGTHSPSPTNPTSEPPLVVRSPCEPSPSTLSVYCRPIRDVACRNATARQPFRDLPRRPMDPTVAPHTT